MRDPSSRSPTAVDKAVGERIRQLRTEAGKTLSELGAELGISHQQLQKYETGANRLSAGMLAKVAAVLDVSIQDLFNEPVRRPRPFLPKEVRQLTMAREAIDALLQAAG